MEYLPKGSIKKYRFSDISLNSMLTLSNSSLPLCIQSQGEAQVPEDLIWKILIDASSGIQGFDVFLSIS